MSAAMTAAVAACADTKSGVREAELHRLAVGPADQVVDAGRRREVVPPGAVRTVRAFRAERGQGEVDDVGLERADVVVRDAEPGQGVFADVGDEDVGRGDELLEHRTSLRAVDLEPDAALLRGREVECRDGVAADRLVELRGDPTGAAHAQRVGFPRRLHADDVGAELREVARRHGGGDAVAQLEDAETLEREPHLAAVVHAARHATHSGCGRDSCRAHLAHTGEQQRGTEAQRRREVGLPITDPGVDGAHRERRQHLSEAARVHERRELAGLLGVEEDDAERPLEPEVLTGEAAAVVGAAVELGDRAGDRGHAGWRRSGAPGARAGRRARRRRSGLGRAPW